MPDHESASASGSDHEAVRVLARHLQGMRRGIESYRTGARSTAPEAQERLAALLGRYDLALMQMAVFLDVAIGPQAVATNQKLSDEFRSLLENRVSGAGVEPAPPAP